MAGPPGVADYSDRRGEERRLYRAGALWAPVGLAPLQARTLDLSVSGLGLVSPVNPPVGTRCQVRFVVPTRDHGPMTIDAMAKVARSIFSSAEDGFRVGLMFEPLPEEATRAIQRFVRGG